MTTTVTESGLRERAAARFAGLGWPNTRNEEWRYTNLGPVQKIDWTADVQGRADLLGEEGKEGRLTAMAALELVFVNGRLVERRGEAKFPEPDENTSIADWQQNAMVALNAANMQDGARIEIAPNSVVEGFIHLLFIGRGDGVWAHPRNLIVVGRNAQVSIVETYLGSGSYFTNAVTEIVAGEGAVVDHTRLESESLEAFHVGNVYVREGRSASVISRNIAVGAALARIETHVALDGEGASVSLDGLFAGTGQQHIDNRTVIDHAQPHCESHELYKGVLDQSARGVFDGRIIVRPGAVKTVSRQENRNLLLSESAIVDSKPTLEIHNDDVKCNHGSTIGQIEAEPLFYLRSRGIGEEEARTLLVHAFASEIVDRIRIEPVREQARRALFHSMPERLPERRGGAR